MKKSLFLSVLLTLGSVAVASQPMSYPRAEWRLAGDIFMHTPGVELFCGVIHPSAGMLCYLLENKQSTRIVADFAKWIAEYVFRNQMELWGDQMEREITSSFEEQTERGAANSLLALLPQRFTVSDLIQLRVRNGQSVKASAVSMVLNRWKKNKRIRKFDENTWQKQG